MSHQLEFCKKCVKKTFSSSEGIVCGLTSAKPTFLSSCLDFEKDVKEERKIAERKAMAEADTMYDDNGKPVPTWRTALSVIIFIIVMIRLIMRLSK